MTSHAAALAYILFSLTISYNGYWHAHDISLTHGEIVTQIIDLIMAENVIPSYIHKYVFSNAPEH